MTRSSTIGHDAVAEADAQRALAEVRKRAMNVVTSSSRISGAGWHVPASEMHDLEVALAALAKATKP